MADAFGQEGGAGGPVHLKGSKVAGAATVGTSATAIVGGNARRRFVTLYNNGASTVYLGKSTVTVATGFPLAAGRYLEDIDTLDEWYGIVASGTGDVRYLEVTA